MTATSATLDQRPGTDRPASRPAQQSALARIAGWCHDHRWWVLIVWLVALVAFNVFAQAAGSAFTNNLTGGKQQVQQILNANFPTQAGSPAQVVVTTGTPFTDAANQARTTQAGRCPARRCPTCPRWSARSRPAAPPRFRATGISPTSGSSSIEQAGNLPTAAITKVINTAESFKAPGLPGGHRRRGHRAGGRGQARLE